MTKTVAITTPTGNVGSKLIPHLLQYAQTHDIEVVLLARSHKRSPTGLEAASGFTPVTSRIRISW